MSRLTIPPSKESLTIHSSMNDTKVWYPWNVMYKHYKKLECFTTNNVSKETKEEFVFCMEQIANEHGVRTQIGMDFQFFKKKGKDEYVFADMSIKTSTLAFTDDWIQNAICAHIEPGLSSESESQQSINLNKKKLTIKIPPMKDQLVLHGSESPHTQRIIWYPWNVMYKHYKKTDLFMKHNIKKDSRDDFVIGMNKIANEKGVRTQDGVDFQFFKKKGKEEYVTASPELKSATVAFSSNWISHSIIGYIEENSDLEIEPTLDDDQSSPEVEEVPEQESIPEVEEVTEQETNPEVEVVTEQESIPEHEEITKQETNPEAEEVTEQESNHEDEEVTEHEDDSQTELDNAPELHSDSETEQTHDLKESDDESEIKVEKDDDIEDDEYDAIKWVNSEIKKEKRKSKLPYKKKKFATIGTQTVSEQGPSNIFQAYVALKMLPQTEQHTSNHNDDKWFDVKTIMKYF